MSAASQPSEFDLTALMGFDRAALAQRWAAIFGHPAPTKANEPLLRGALAWHLQMEALRKSAGTREVQRMVRSVTQASPQVLSPGTQLMREWQGKTHRVSVLASGFEYEGESYRSLTAVTRRITGTAWSGPLFFGLRR